MKYIKSYILFFLMVFAVTGCTTDDLKDDVNDLKDRVTLIEEQVKLLNDNLAVIAYILDTQNKTISEVKNVTDNGEVTQKKIVLSDGTELTLTIGKPGTINEPEVTVGEDKTWYINGKPTGVIAVGEPGKNGEGYPEFRVHEGNWQVRFGDGEWKLVDSGENVADGSLGDQFFVKAEVVDDNFVVTMTDGTVHTLPIVADLACAIDKTDITLDAEGFWVIEKGARVEVPVKIIGENPQVTYPQGWRATLSKLDAADNKGNNYKLYIYAPAAAIKTMNTRAAANNTSDITVQVQKGSFWAVDKIKVKTPKELNTNEERYNDGQTIRVGGLEITRELYGDVKAVPADGKLTEGGVYFISESGKRLTYSLGISGVESLVILPNTEEVSDIKLRITSQIYFTNTLAFQNVNLNNSIENQYPLRAKGTVGKITLDNCKVNNLSIGKGLMIPDVASTDHLVSFEMRNSEIKIEQSGAGMNIMFNMDCDLLTFENNIVYYSGDVPKTQEYANHMTNFKVFSGQNKIIKELIMNSNTFVDVESTGTSGVTGLVWASSIGKVTFNKNLYWQSYPATQFIKPAPITTTVLLRGIPKKEDYVAEGSSNYGYNGNATMKTFQLCFGSERPATMTELIVVKDMFVTFDKSTGTFIPKDEYKAYGAQR